MKDHREERLIARALGEVGEAIDETNAEVRRELEEIGDVLDLVDRFEAPEPGPGFETRLWARVEERIEQDADGKKSWAVWGVVLGGRRLAWAAGVAAVAVVAFLAGSIWERGSAADPTVRERVLVVAIGDHLQRSQRLLVEVVNEDRPEAGVFESGRLRAQSLAETNRLFRASLEGDATVDDPVAELLGDLESVLLEIANGPNEPTAADWARLKRRIEKRGLLLRIQVLGDPPTPLPGPRPGADRT